TGGRSTRGAASDRDSRYARSVGAPTEGELTPSTNHPGRASAQAHRSHDRRDAVERAARAVYESAVETIGAGIKTPDLGGHAGTTEFTDAVIERISSKLEIWSQLGSPT